jgi:hypothetical protein
LWCEDNTFFSDGKTIFKSYDRTTKVVCLTTKKGAKPLGSTPLFFMWLISFQKPISHSDNQPRLASRGLPFLPESACSNR